MLALAPTKKEKSLQHVYRCAYRIASRCLGQVPAGCRTRHTNRLSTLSALEMIVRASHVRCFLSRELSVPFAGIPSNQRHGSVELHESHPKRAFA